MEYHSLPQSSPSTSASSDDSDPVVEEFVDLSEWTPYCPIPVSLDDELEWKVCLHPQWGTVYIARCPHFLSAEAAPLISQQHSEVSQDGSPSGL